MTKNLFFSPFITSSRKFHSPFFHVHVLPFNYNFIEIFFPPPFTIIHYSLAIFLILCSKWVFFHYHIIIFLTAFCHFPLSPLQCPDLPWPNLLSLASSSITLIFLFLDLINIRPIGYPWISWQASLFYTNSDVKYVRGIYLSLMRNVSFSCAIYFVIVLSPMNAKQSEQ